MTGQGNRSHEQIKKAASHSAGALNLNKTYRTRNNQRVRSLTTFYTRKMIIGGVVTEGIQREVIRGQAYLRNAHNHFEWQDQIWEIDGRHILHVHLDLREYQEPPAKQLQLI
jgi:hypothetical protein